jgi:ribosomal RNA-processing protein 1
MTDRPLPQQALAADLANLLFTVRPACADAWLRGFWTVVGAQWTGIDVLRLEKFLLLVRRVFAAHVVLAKNKGYEGSESDMVLAVFRDWPFDKEGDLRRVPVGIRLHALDIWIDELEKLETLEDPKAQAFVRTMGDMVEELKRCPVKQSRQRSAEVLEDERLPWVAKEEVEVEEDDEEWGGIDD